MPRAGRSFGCGPGGARQLPEYEAGAQTIIIEAEMPEKAEDEAMAVRRLGFYARCGAKDTGWTEHLFDAWFRVLVLPCCGGKVRSPEEAVRQLADCYRNSLELAKTYDIHSIAFPAISTGVYGYPLDAATQIAVDTVADWLQSHADYDMRVIFCCFDARTKQAYQTKME